MLYVIFLGSDYDKGKVEAFAWISDKGMARAEEKGANKHRGLLEEVMEGRRVEGDKHITTYYRITRRKKQAEQRTANKTKVAFFVKR